MGSCGKVVVSVCWEDLTASFPARMNEIGAEPVLSTLWEAPLRSADSRQNIIVNIKKALFLAVVTWKQARLKMLKVRHCCVNNQQH